MKDIALAGFVLTAEEWAALDAGSRAALVNAASTRRHQQDDPWVVGNISQILEAPIVEEGTDA